MSEKTTRVLVVDDEESIRCFLSLTLGSQGYEIVEAAFGEKALSIACFERLDLVILDLGLPDIDGIEVTRRLRRKTNIPIIILSIRGSEVDKIAALDAGANDYLTKPFGAGELLARMRAALRHKLPPNGESVFTKGELRIDIEKRLVKVADRDIQLTPNEYDILKTLVIHAGRVLTHRHILQEVWGEQYGDELHMLHVNISNLRRKIEPDLARPFYIITEPGVGYRLRVD
jgi:two-component system KDP operon response regulator KdpE